MGQGAPRYVDATTLTVVNKAQPGGPSLQRLDVSRYPELPAQVHTYMTYTTGLAVAFRTDSRNLYARWSTSDPATSNNTTLINQCGLDLYIRKEGHWTFAGVGTPGWSHHHASPVVENMNAGEKECLLYLPLFNRLDTLEIGIDSTATLVPLDNPFRKKVVVIGSSITHGASAGRPGLTYPALLERALDVEFCNLGACGLCKLDPFYSEIAADSKADAFLFDAFSNPNAREIEERLVPFVQRIRSAHPTTPLIILQTEVRETGTFDRKKRAYEERKRLAAEAGMKELMATDENLYFINPGMPLGEDHDGTTDGVHPNDAGFAHIVRHLIPHLREILNK